MLLWVCDHAHGNISDTLILSVHFTIKKQIRMGHFLHRE